MALNKHSERKEMERGHRNIFFLCLKKKSRTFLWISKKHVVYVFIFYTKPIQNGDRNALIKG